MTSGTGKRYNPIVPENARSQALDWEEARRIVIETVRALPRSSEEETVSLAEAHGRVLAQLIPADRDYPALRRSLRDGFAVRASDVPGKLAMGVRQPAGVVAAIAPWNAPLNLTCRAVGIPLICGNTVVLKGSEYSPRSQALIVELLHEVCYIQPVRLQESKD